MIDTSIWFTFEFEALHYYPLASGTHEYLKHEHRHIFKAKVYVAVTHDDREIEFIDAKRTVRKEYMDSISRAMSAHSELAILDLGAKSCETIAKEILDICILKYGNRKYWIELSEDGENGAFIEYSPSEEFFVMPQNTYQLAFDPTPTVVAEHRVIESSINT